MQEIVLRFALFFGAVLAVRYSARYHRPIRTAFRRLARHKTACIVSLALFPIALRLAMLPKLGPPEPFIHDEFSYLLAGDTFAHGRMTNPPHPMWIHFETMHEQFIPAYASKYPPGQGLFLAFGQRLSGSPWVGVLLSVALLSASLTWMLQGWLPPAWALLGSIIGVVNLTVSTYWVDSYWGGAVAGLGGCLVMGAYPRLKKHSTVRDSLLFAIGILLLANTRPYEGLVVSAAVCIALIVHSVKSKSIAWAMPAVVLAAAGGALMAAYNYRVTGSPVVMPYMLNDDQYAVAPAFIFMPIRPMRQYNHEVLRKFWLEFDVDFYKNTMADLTVATIVKCFVFWQTYIRSWLLTIPILIAPLLVTSRRGRFPLLVLALFVCAIFIEKGTLSHYTAPIAGIFFVVLTLALHRLYLWRPDGKPIGKQIANVVLVSCAFNFAIHVLHYGEGQFIGPTPFSQARRRIVAQLNGTPASHLVLVRYRPEHRLHDEWVYNDADIDGSKTVWAREMNPDADEELLKYYPQRKVWLLEADLKEPKLTLIR